MKRLEQSPFMKQISRVSIDREYLIWLLGLLEHTDQDEPVNAAACYGLSRVDIEYARTVDKDLADRIEAMMVFNEL